MVHDFIAMKFYATLRILEMIHYDTFHKEYWIVSLNRFHGRLIKELHGIFLKACASSN